MTVGAPPMRRLDKAARTGAACAAVAGTAAATALVWGRRRGRGVVARRYTQAESARAAVASLQEEAGLRIGQNGYVIRGRPAFSPPPHVPTTWWQAVHHMMFVCFSLGVAIFAPWALPPLPLVVFMFLYGDFMSALLHCTFDHEECLDLPVLGFVANGFQMHHAYPAESTSGVGLYRLCCDTVRVQWILLATFALFSSHSVLAAQILYLKMLFAAYGSAVGHFYAHHPAKERPAVVHLLQRLHILLPPQHHAVHHKAPYREHLTSVSGLADSLINPILRSSEFLPCIATLGVLTVVDNRVIEAMFSLPWPTF